MCDLRMLKEENTKCDRKKNNKDWAKFEETTNDDNDAIKLIV